jgi:hypothetical protein
MGERTTVLVVSTGSGGLAMAIEPVSVAVDEECLIIARLIAASASDMSVPPVMP